MTAHGASTGTAVRPVLPLLALSEVAFALVNLAAVVGLRRVFDDTTWLGPLALHVVVAHATMAALRRGRLGVAASTVTAAVVGLLVISWVHVGELTTFGIPRPATLTGLADAVRSAFAEFSDISAPVEALDGFVIASAEAVWLTAIIGDWAAFRVRASIEAILPAATLFGVATVLGADVHRTAFAGLWIGAVVVFVLLRRADSLDRHATWVGDRRRRGPRALVVVGLALGGAATLLAALVGPQLPGARSEALVSLTDIGDRGAGTRVTVSPLVDIRSRLVDQADVEVFTVRSDVRSYWRLTSLDRFDGQIWASNGSFGKSSGTLESGEPVESPGILVTQQFQIAALAQIWLPAAYEPQQVSVTEPVRYDEVSGTLIVDTEVPTSDGTSYGVISELARHDPNALATASVLVPQYIVDQYLGLPEDFSPAVTELAREITAGSTSAYEASLRLQNFFRAEFTYDLGIGPGHSANAIEQFVFEQRRGYCEQFAGSFAAMARSLGIPARVAVGFTPGVTDAADATLYRVRGEHAHAWPEVFLGEYGWVSFEPTPGRGAPFAEQYTGVPEQQVVSGGDPTTATTSVSPPSTTATAEAVPVPGAFTEPEPDATVDGGGPAEPETDRAPNPWFARIGLAAVILVLAVGTYLVAVLTATALRRSRRRGRAVGFVGRVGLAWDESLAAMRRAGVPVIDSETQRHTADRIAARFPEIDEPVRTLATAVETVTFGPGADELDRDGATADGDVLALADRIEAHVAASMTPRARLQARLHPRRLFSD